MIWKLLIFGIVMSVVLFTLGYYIGRWYAAQHKMFRSKLNHLDFVIRHLPASDHQICKTEIEDQFREIRKMDCFNEKEEEEIDNLYDLFKEKISSN